MHTEPLLLPIVVDTIVGAHAVSHLESRVVSPPRWRHRRCRGRGTPVGTRHAGQGMSIIAADIGANLVTHCSVPLSPHSRSPHPAQAALADCVSAAQRQLTGSVQGRVPALPGPGRRGQRNLM